MKTRLGIAGCMLAVTVFAAAGAEDIELVAAESAAETDVPVVEETPPRLATRRVVGAHSGLISDKSPLTLPHGTLLQAQPVTSQPVTAQPHAVHSEPSAIIHEGGPVPHEHGAHPWSDEWADATFDDAFPPIWSHWTVNFDALFWRRSTPSDFPLARVMTPPVPNAANFTFDHEGGPRLAIIRRGISGWDLELNYLGIESWHSPLQMVEDADPRVPGDDEGGLYTLDLNLFVGGLTIDYRTTLHSEELNFRRALNETWTGLIGFRALQLHERYDTTDIFGFPFYTISTDNRLYGFQVGGEGKLIGTERFGILTVFKAGLFENNSEQLTTDFSGILAGLNSPTSLTESDNQASFVGEIGIWGIWRISETLFIRAGYNIMWIDDLALAVKQIPENEFVTFGQGRPLEGISTDGHLVIHGATVGVEMSW